MKQAPGDFLGRMAAASHARATAAMAQKPAALLAERVRGLAPPPALRLSASGFDLIAELKRRSPALGTLARSSLQIAGQARAYARGGAAALSVLTEPSEFDGDLAHLVEAAAAADPVPARRPPGGAGAPPPDPVPAMRKDFLVLPYQILEARAAGAAGVLLIVAMLDDARLAEMLQLALELELFVLLEVFDEADLERCSRLLPAAGQAVVDGRCRYMVGVNCRDLRTLAVDFGRFAALAPALPGQVPRVAESGVLTDVDAARVASLGYQLALVGTALMRSGDPAATLTGLLAAGRSSVAACIST